jgi:hypothetical protein
MKRQMQGAIRNAAGPATMHVQPRRRLLHNARVWHTADSARRMRLQGKSATFVRTCGRPLQRPRATTSVVAALAVGLLDSYTAPRQVTTALGGLMLHAVHWVAQRNVAGAATINVQPRRRHWHSALPTVSGACATRTKSHIKLGKCARTCGRPRRRARDTSSEVAALAVGLLESYTAPRQVTTAQVNSMPPAVTKTQHKLQHGHQPHHRPNHRRGRRLNHRRRRQPNHRRRRQRPRQHIHQSTTSQARTNSQ